jgi:hypothetical protein
MATKAKKAKSKTKSKPVPKKAAAAEKPAKPDPAPAKKSKAKVDVGVVAEIAAALGEHAPDAKTEKGKAYLKALVYAVADEEKFSDKQYDALSDAAKKWLNQAEAVLKKNEDADVPEPTAEEEPEDDADSEDDGGDDADSEDDGGDDAPEEDEPADKKKSKKKVEPADDDDAEPAAPKKKAKGKGSKAEEEPATKKGEGKAKGKKAESDKDLTAALEYGKKQLKEGGPVQAIRAITNKFKTFERRDVMAVAEKLDINKFTASRQFHVARAGGDKE